MKDKRPSKDKYYLGIADSVSKRSTCLRRQIGAVIVSNDQIISTGYVGAPRGVPNCCDLGVCYRDEKKISHGEHYEKCRSVHAEANAIIHASREQMFNSTLYLSGRDLKKENYPLFAAFPCMMCRRLIINAGIRKVVTLDEEGKVHERLTRDWIEEADKNPFDEIESPEYK